MNLRKVLGILVTVGVIAAAIGPTMPVAAADFTIKAYAGVNGTISPQGGVLVPETTDQSFTITANEGFTINDVQVDGVSLGPQASPFVYTFTNVVAAHNIAASFAPGNLLLVGASTMTLTKADVDAMAIADPSGTYTDGNSHTWQGTALWRVIAKVDDNDPNTLNAALVGTYSIKFTAADGYTKTILPADISGTNFPFANNNDIFLANKVDLAGGDVTFIDVPPARPTDASKLWFPFGITGGGIGSTGMRVNAVIKIELLGLPSTAVSIPSMSVANGASFSLPVNIDTDTAARGWQLNISFDAAKLTLNSVTEGGFLLDYAIANGGGTVSGGAPSINNTAGTASIPGYAISGAGTGGPTGTGVLCLLNFTAKADINDYALVTPLNTSVISDVNAVTIPGVTWTAGTVAIGAAPMPDLIISSASTTKIDDGNYTVTFTVKNNGDLDCGATTATVFVDGGTPKTFAIGALAAGATETKTSTNIALPGATDSIVITADSTNAVAEANEANNGKSLTYSLVGAEGDTPISGNIGAILILTCPDEIVDWNLVYGPNSQTGNVNVKSNANYEVRASDANATNGHMSEYNPTTEEFVSGGLALIQPMHVVAENDVTLPGPGLLLNGIPAGQNMDMGENFPVTFNQQVMYADPVLTNGNVYHIVVSFTASVTF